MPDEQVVVEEVAVDWVDEALELDVDEVEVTVLRLLEDDEVDDVEEVVEPET